MTGAMCKVGKEQHKVRKGHQGRAVALFLGMKNDILGCPGGLHVGTYLLQALNYMQKKSGVIRKLSTKLLKG